MSFVNLTTEKKRSVSFTYGVNLTAYSKKIFQETSMTKMKNFR